MKTSFYRDCSEANGYTFWSAKTDRGQANIIRDDWFGQRRYQVNFHTNDVIDYQGDEPFIDELGMDDCISFQTLKEAKQFVREILNSKP